MKRPNESNTQKNKSKGKYSSKSNMKQKAVKQSSPERKQRWSEYAGYWNN
jgi:hypothetical protein